MDDEFKLCWKNFQDNIASGFQNLYDRGDLVDVTLACDGKLLHAHKIVLAICSPYFQEIFITNPCKHPIIILKDVHFNIMCELLEFMYQGVVNVKHTELQSFMKIGQLLHIKGLATNSSAANTLSEKSSNKKEGPTENTTNMCTDPTKSPSVTSDASRGEKESNSVPTTKGSFGASLISPASSPSPVTSHEIKGSPDSFMLHGFQSSVNQKRPAESDNDSQIFYNKKQFRKSSSHTDQFSDQINDDRGTDHAHPEDFFLSSVPHISMTEPRYDISNIKREGDPSGTCISNSGRNSLGTPFGFDYNLYKNNCDTNIGTEFSNELNLINDCSKNFANHMDIPPSSNSVTMLSSTSLLHGNCVFNRNNTVATQQGMKTYWLCKSYRISMCRARCITHQGRVISATGVHNHPPHMRKGPVVSSGGYLTEGAQMLPPLPTTNSYAGLSVNNIPPAASQSGGANMSNTATGCFSSLRLSQATSNVLQQNQPLQHLQSMSVTSSASSHLHPYNLAQQHSNLMIQQLTANSNVTNSSQGSQSSLPLVSQNSSSVNHNIVHPPATGYLSTSHAPYIRDSSVQNLNSTLVITSVATESAPNICAPSNLSKHSQLRSSLSGLPFSGRTTESPPHANADDHEDKFSSSHMPENIALDHNAVASPPNVQTTAKTVDRSGPSPTSTPDTPCIATPGQVTESVTICPVSEHSFKIEDM